MTPTARWALAADAVAVLAFVLIGRASHDESDAVTGLLRTLWPFAAGLAVGWVVLLRRTSATTRVSAGLVTGAYTAVVGLALRALTGQGVALSFLVVALIVLVVFMTGWRVAWAAAASTRRRTGSGAGPPAA